MSNIELIEDYVGKINAKKEKYYKVYTKKVSWRDKKVSLCEQRTDVKEYFCVNRRIRS